MICSTCRLARQQLARRLTAPAIAAAPMTTTTTATTATTAATTVTAATTMAARRLASRMPLPLSLHSARLFSQSRPASSATQPSAPPATPSTLPKPDFLDEAEAHIWDLLAAAFAPAELSVRDISGGCGSMYGIEISSDKFRGATMLKQQRMVNAVLGDLVKGWHGVQLKTRVP